MVVQLLVLAIFKARYLVLFAGFMTTQLYTKRLCFFVMLLLIPDRLCMCLWPSLAEWKPGLLSKDFFQAVINVENLEAEKIVHDALFACQNLECIHRSLVLLSSAGVYCVALVLYLVHLFILTCCFVRVGGIRELRRLSLFALQKLINHCFLP